MTRKRIAAIAGVVAAVLLLGVGYLVWPRGSSEVTEDEALEDFRSRTASAEEPGAAGSSATPGPGVYTYDASGQEEVKLGVLPTEVRPYPDAVTVSIVGEGTDCFTATLNLLDQHTEDTTYCVTEGGLRMASHEKRQQIGALSPRATVSCDPDLLFGPDVNSTGLACDMTVDGGPAQLTAELTGTATSEPMTLEVGDEAVEAVRIDLSYVAEGGLTGTWTERVWLAEADMLPLRIERDLDLSGLAEFTEESALRLTSTTPAR